MDRDTEILRLYREGKMMKEIAASVGMAPNSIVGILRRLGVARPSKPQKRWGGKEDITAAVLSLWDQGMCASQISERLQSSLGLVNGILTRAKVRDSQSRRHRYDGSAPGGSGRDGFAGAMARKT